MRLDPWSLALALALVAPLCATGCASARARGPSLRAIWVTRWDYVTEADVRQVIDDCAGAGFDTLLFQVRGNATAFYRSSHEPWAEQLGSTDPGYDPLELATRLAHERGMELHAWVNVVPAWWGSEPPSDPTHLYHTRPEWFWYDQNEERQALSDDFYVSLNPCLPAVRSYLTEVMRELVARYDVDGLHLDYIRFPNEAPAIPANSGLDYPRDARTLELYREATGKTPDDDPAAWDAWRTGAVTQLLRDIRAAVRATDPDVSLSAAVGAEPERALHHFQDVESWLDEGLLEGVFPMNYTADEAIFRGRLEAWREREGARVVMGLMVGTGPQDVRRAQIVETSETFGSFAVFAYASLFDSRNRTIDRQDEATRAARRARREVFLPLLKRL